MSESSLVNSVTSGLAPYPMEELTRIRLDLQKRGKPVFDFGTGDPKIPTWSKIREAMQNAIPEISQYPSVKGTPALREAQLKYFKNRFGLTLSEDMDIIPSAGSKEAIFHIALALVGRSNGKKVIIYPDPGYPVYQSSTLFAGGTPYAVPLKKEDKYLLKPWALPRDIQRSAAAIWINYPHNPTGATADRSYYEEVIAWAHSNDCVVLSDDCYVDIYNCQWDEASAKKDCRPICPLSISSDRVLTFMSLSKRSGLTGYRSGFVAGDKRILSSFLKARANFGVGSQTFVDAAACVAWADEAHVQERRKIFSKRLQIATPALQSLGLIDGCPEATFYLWCKIPKQFKLGDDVAFCLSLAEQGLITSPSQWLSESIKGYFRIALVPGEEDTKRAFDILTQFIKGMA